MSVFWINTNIGEGSLHIRMRCRGDCGNHRTLSSHCCQISKKSELNSARLNNVCTTAFILSGGAFNMMPKEQPVSLSYVWIARASSTIFLSARTALPHIRHQQ